MILASQLNRALDQLVRPASVLMVHASLRSFGEPIDGGADALLDALLARDRTVLVPAFTEPQFTVAAPTAMRPDCNGIDYATQDALSSTSASAIYTVDCRLINTGLGVLPATVLNRAGAVRGEHPLNSFAALGPLANELIARQSAADVYGPVQELVARDGVILLIGVGLNRMTAVHLAEQQSGRRLFLRWARGTDGQVGMFEVGSCSEGFPRLEPILDAYARTANIGASRWRAYPARRTLAAATATIAADQSITHCPNADCLLCRDSISGGPVGQFAMQRRASP